MVEFSNWNYDTSSTVTILCRDADSCRALAKQ